jgi:hypothetical protein
MRENAICIVRKLYQNARGGILSIGEKIEEKDNYVGKMSFALFGNSKKIPKAVFCELVHWQSNPHFLFMFELLRNIAPQKHKKVH